jgi:hypothetical protein
MKNTRGQHRQASPDRSLTGRPLGPARYRSGEPRPSGSGWNANSAPAAFAALASGEPAAHRVPPAAKVLMPASIERSVWEYFSGKAQQKRVNLSELLTEVLKRDIEINEALK